MSSCVRGSSATTISHPDRTTLVVSGDGCKHAAILSDVAGAAAASKALFGAHHSVWESAGLSRLWSGAVVGDALHATASAGLATHPSTLVVVGAEGKKDLKDIMTSLTDAQKEKLDARVKVSLGAVLMLLSWLACTPSGVMGGGVISRCCLLPDVVAAGAPCSSSVWLVGWLMAVLVVSAAGAQRQGSSRRNCGGGCEGLKRAQGRVCLLRVREVIGQQCEEQCTGSQSLGAVGALRGAPGWIQAPTTAQCHRTCLPIASPFANRVSPEREIKLSHGTPVVVAHHGPPPPTTPAPPHSLFVLQCVTHGVVVPMAAGRPTTLHGRWRSASAPPSASTTQRTPTS